MTSSLYAVNVMDPAPQDAISRVTFGPNNSPLILVSSWAGTIAIYDCFTGTLKRETNIRSVVLDSTWVSDSLVTAGALDGTVALGIVREHTLETRTLGLHSSGVRAVTCLPEHGLIASGGWDSRLMLWDVRACDRLASIDAGGKVYGTTRCGEHGLAFITSNLQIRLIDYRNPSLFLYDIIPATLSRQLRGISSPANGKQIVVGSTEGRVAVEYIDEPTRSYSFRCHRVEDIAYPINCIVHNRKYSSFTTGGADGYVSFWDADAKKRITQFSRYPTSVASLDFNTEVQRIAIAVSYTFEEGEKDHPPDEVISRRVDENQLATRDTAHNIQ